MINNNTPTNLHFAELVSEFSEACSSFNLCVSMFNISYVKCTDKANYLEVVTAEEHDYFEYTGLLGADINSHQSMQDYVKSVANQIMWSKQKEERFGGY